MNQQLRLLSSYWFWCEMKVWQGIQFSEKFCHHVLNLFVCLIFYFLSSLEENKQFITIANSSITCTMTDYYIFDPRKVRGTLLYNSKAPSHSPSLKIIDILLMKYCTVQNIIRCWTVTAAITKHYSNQSHQSQIHQSAVFSKATTYFIVFFFIREIIEVWHMTTFPSNPLSNT